MNAMLENEPGATGSVAIAIGAMLCGGVGSPPTVKLE
jgi:hypothetical protein